jgi:hypothetical protein
VVTRSVLTMTLPFRFLESPGRGTAPAAFGHAEETPASSEEGKKGGKERKRE